MPFNNAFSEYIWKTNYRYTGEKTWSDTCKRVAKAVSDVERTKKKREKYFKEFYDILYNKKFIPGGRILANAGVNERKNATLFNCYVYHPSDYNPEDIDSLDNIFESVKQSAKILGREGGLGINLSYLRPEGMYINGIGNRTPGPLKFAEIWDKVSEVITAGTEKLVGEKQEGEKLKIRKGAMMLVMEVWNETILDFIKAKQKSNRFTKFNFSVGITEGFMDAVENDETWTFKFPDTNFEKYEKEWDGNINKWIEKGYPIIETGSIKARKLWDKIMISTYNRNEPGVLFLDNANRLSPINYCNHLKTSNPCAEIITTNVCNLGSINLTKFIDLNTIKNKDEIINMGDYRKTIKLAVRFLDNVNTIGNPAIDDYNKPIKDFRNIGIGITGLGSFLMLARIEYGSWKSQIVTDVLMRDKHEIELLTSAKLGKEKGSFKKFDKKKYFNTDWWKNNPISKEIKNKIEKIGHMRNATHSTIAPTGNTSIAADVVSGGVEPVFMKQYKRWITVTGYEIGALKRNGYDIPDISKGEWHETDTFKLSKRGDEEILKGKINNIEYEIDKNRGLTKGIEVKDYAYKHIIEQDLLDTYPDNSLKTALELPIENHLNILSLCAKYVNNSISKCVDKNTSMIILNNKIYYLDELIDDKQNDIFVEVNEDLITVNHKNEKVKINSFYNNGKKECIKITLDDNSTLTATFNHRVFINNEDWIKMCDLKIGDIIRL